MSQKAMLIDATLCVGCGDCVSACREANGLPESDEYGGELNADTYCVVNEKGDQYARKLCMHCLEPACVSVCPVAALVKTEDGPVLWDEARCIGCRYCMVACAFDVPSYEWHSANPRVRKCVFCSERLQEGKIPACAEACPAEATMFGSREEMLKEARRRIAESPDEYLPEIFGEHEIGGTSMLFISPVPFASLGLPAGLGTRPLPEYTRAVLTKLPGVLVVGGTFLAGMSWLTRRKNEVAALERARGEESGR